MLLTLEELQEQQLSALYELRDIAGSASHLANMLDVPYYDVNNWFSAGRISPKGFELVINHPTFCARMDVCMLRPDITIEEKTA